MTSGLCSRQAVILIEEAKFPAHSSSLSSHTGFSFDSSATLIRFLNGQQCCLLSFLTSSDPQGSTGAILEAHHTVFRSLWCNVSLWQMTGLYRAFAQNQKTQRGTLPGINSQPATNSTRNGSSVSRHSLSDGTVQKKGVLQGGFDLLPHLKPQQILAGRAQVWLACKKEVHPYSKIYFISSKSQGFCNMWLQPLKSLWETFHHSFFPSQTALIEAPVQISPHFKGLKFQRRWALPCQFIPRLFFLLLGGDDASILKGDINKPKRLFLSQFHGSTAHQTPEKEKPTYFELPVQLQALSTEVCFCDPACESQKQEDRNISMTWHGDRQSDTAQRQAGLKGAG